MKYGIITLLAVLFTSVGSAGDLDLFHNLDVFDEWTADEFPDPSKVKIAKIAYAGTGCKAGSVSEVLAPDAKAFTLLFDSYVAEAGPDKSLNDGRKNCQVAVDMRFPQGYSYTVFQVDYRGYAQLERGVSGIQKTNYYFQGQAMGPALQSKYVGPLSEDYQIRDTLGIDSIVWSPCGEYRALNMNTQVRVQATGSRRGLMTVDSIDGLLKHRYGIQWRRCH